jgi:hypothetical protein
VQGIDAARVRVAADQGNTRQSRELARQFEHEVLRADLKQNGVLDQWGHRSIKVRTQADERHGRRGVAIENLHDPLTLITATEWLLTTARGWLAAGWTTPLNKINTMILIISLIGLIVCAVDYLLTIERDR